MRHNLRLNQPYNEDFDGNSGRRRTPHSPEDIRQHYWVAVAIAGSALVGAGTAVYEGNQSRKAIGKQQDLLNGLSYTPIDVAALQKSATETSIKNATDSLALQRSLQPNVARSNDLLQKSVADQLALGGQLPPDVANEVNRAGRTIGSSSGSLGNSAPVTAALLGQTSLGLLNQRQNAAMQLSAANPLPTVGLSPQDLASATIANNNALNQFALGKAGGQANLINSQAQSNSATAAGVGGSLSSELSLLALSGYGKNTTPVKPDVIGYNYTPPKGPSGLIAGGSASGSLIPGYT